MPRDRHATLLALLVAGAFFMENLDGTVIATALPQMAESFGVEAPSLAIGMTAYLLTLAVFIPASGWMADRFGARRVFTSAIVVFTVASVLCALSQGRWEFTLARVLQGCGGALMTPVGRLVVLRDTPKPELMRAIATLTWPALVAPVLGPPVGGFITSVSSWRWIFLLNVPLGFVGVACALRLVGDTRDAVVRPFDVQGFLLNGIALASLLYASELLGQTGAQGWLTGVMLGVSVLAGWAALRHARRHPHPLVGLQAFGVPSFAITLSSGFLSRVVISTMPFLLPLLFQLGLGLDPFVSGLLVLWYGLSNLGIKPATSPILRRFGFRQVLLVNTVLNAVAIGGCALIGPATPAWVIATLLLLAGASRSMQFTALNTLGFAEMPPSLTGAANTLFNMAFQLAIGLGIACGAIVLRATDAVAGEGMAALPFHWAFLAIAIIGLVPLPGFLRLRPDVGAGVSGHRAA